MFDLVKAFIAAYNAALQAGFPHAENRRWRVILPWVLVRLAHYKGLDGKFRLFRYSHWIPAQWREFHELYELARMRARGSASSSCSAPARSRSRASSSSRST